VLWQHVFQAVVCIECRTQCMYDTLYAQQPETHVTPTLQNF
jgi:hypothetical protein